MLRFGLNLVLAKLGYEGVLPCLSIFCVDNDPSADFSFV